MGRWSVFTPFSAYSFKHKSSFTAGLSSRKRRPGSVSGKAFWAMRTIFLAMPCESSVCASRRFKIENNLISASRSWGVPKGIARPLIIAAAFSKFSSRTSDSTYLCTFPLARRSTKYRRCLLGEAANSSSAFTTASWLVVLGKCAHHVARIASRDVFGIARSIGPSAVSMLYV